MDDRNFKNLPLTKLSYKKFLKSTIFFHNVYTEKMSTIEEIDGLNALKVYYYVYKQHREILLNLIH